MSVETDVPAAWATTSFSPWDTRLGHTNIWGIYRRIRGHAAAVRSDAHDNFWVIGRYRDVKLAAADHKTFSSGSGMLVGFEGTSEPRGAPIEYDPPEHTRFRSVMAAPFRPTKVGVFKPLVERHVDRVLDTASRQRHFDVVRDIAEPLSVSVISDIIGFSPSEADRNRQLALALISARYEDLATARLPYREFIGHEVDDALRRPRKGLLGEIARRAGDGAFTRDEVCNIVYALALAGHHTTIFGVSSMLLRAAQPEVRDRWLRDPSRVGAFVEESLRIDPPIHLEARRTTGDVEVGDVTVPRGAQVALLFASANQDEVEFEDPGSFNPDRGGKSLSFGHGIHSCLGMELARMEMSAVLEAVLRRFPALSLAGEPIDSGMIFGHLMGWHSVPATFDPGPSPAQGPMTTGAR